MSTIQEILSLTQQLLDSIATADWDTYATLCDPSLSAFEPEARGHLVEGMEFHRFYFELARSEQLVNTTIVAPHVRLLDEDVAVISYIRLTQTSGADESPNTNRFEETRVWHRQDGQWHHVHFHRSANR